MTFRWPVKQGISSDEGRKALRQTILEQIYSAKSGHPGGSLSLVEILASIFDGHFEHKLEDSEWAERDRLVLSKGHGVPALYSAYSFLGYIPAQELVNLRKLGHYLQGHPDRHQFKLMEASTGSLGQGASVALGLAMGLRLQFEQRTIKRLPRVYCILGDGEMQEGQVWETLMAAGKFRPGNLIFILDRNKGQIDGPVEEVMSLNPLVDKIKSFNCNPVSVDGHDVLALKKTLSSFEVRSEGHPLFVIAETQKGKGVSFMEHPTDWHGKAPKKDELDRALKEILGEGNSGLDFGRLLAE